ncbi:MAG: PEP-CTERM sorting domain-containing protein [Opitutales bacterium]|nr:PEP-CTERM sorting domain-containing protein [Opitutales bacterium]
MKKLFLILISISIFSTIHAEVYRKVYIGDFSNKDLSGSSFMSCTYNSSSNFTNSNLTDVYFTHGTSFSSINFTDSIINGVSFSYVEFTASQLKSTASYKNKDLSGVGFSSDSSSMKNIDFSDFNLTKVDFNSDVDLYDTKVYTDFTYANFTNANLTGADFAYTKITSADFTNATITNVNFASSSGFSKEQLCSTKSYKDYNLSGIKLNSSLEDCNLENQNLQRATLNGSLVNTNLTNADLRGATYNDTNGGVTSVPDNYILLRAILKNTIMKNGIIKNISLTQSDDMLTIRRTDTVYNAIISESNATVSGGARIVLENGGVLEIANNKRLSIADGEISFITDSNDSSFILVDESSKLSFGEDSELVINYTGDNSDSYTATILKWDSNASVEGLEYIVNKIKFFVNGILFDGNVTSIIENNSLVVLATAAVPEPSTYAMILGTVALGFVAYRRRK